jgi:hypothetical protein
VICRRWKIEENTFTIVTKSIQHKKVPDKYDETGIVRANTLVQASKFVYKDGKTHVTLVNHTGKIYLKF